MEFTTKGMENIDAAMERVKSKVAAASGAATIGLKFEGLDKVDAIVSHVGQKLRSEGCRQHRDVLAD